MDAKDKITERIAIVEMEIGFLRTVGRSPNPVHRIAAAEVEIDRNREIAALRKDLQALQLSA